MNHKGLSMEPAVHPVQLLQFYADIGVDTVVLDAPQNRLAVSAPSQVLKMAAPAAPATAPATGAIAAEGEAKALAAAAETLPALKDALQAFEGLPAKRTARHTVFADGNPESRILFVTDVPTAEDDRTGVPFSGPVGALFDKMIGAIGLDRTKVYITSVLNWRLPGGAKPAASDIAVSLPFFHRHIALAKPAVIIPMGAVAAQAILGKKAKTITRARGKWAVYEGIPVLPMLHPEYLMATPAQKVQAWADLLALKAKLAELGL
ncbi:MAG: uracil-DNA glycosylase [Alphaproteobacteria bacterium]|nr:uracil-DNA glycosylase [Alphaproteobacteria bacterium]